MNTSPGYDYGNPSTQPSNYNSRITDYGGSRNISNNNYDYDFHQKISPRVSNYRTNNSTMNTSSPGYHQNNYQRRFTNNTSQTQQQRNIHSSPYQRNNTINNRVNLTLSPLNDTSSVYNNATSTSNLQQQRSIGKGSTYGGNRVMGGYENNNEGIAGRRSVTNTGNYYGDYRIGSGGKYSKYGGYGDNGAGGYGADGRMRYTGIGR